VSIKPGVAFTTTEPDISERRAVSRVMRFPLEAGFPFGNPDCSYWIRGLLSSTGMV
jgi:hypothetical protein